MDLRLSHVTALVALIAASLLAACGANPDPEPSAPDPADTTNASLPVLARSGPFRGVNGILFGPDGLLYLASVATPAIASVDPESGRIVEVLGAADGAQGPDDLAFGPDGSLYWTDILLGNVVRRSPDGVTTIVGSPGPGVNPITFSDDGRLFVSQCFLDHRVFEIDPEGATPPRLVTDQLGPGCGLNGMDWGPDGRLYGPRWFEGEVVSVDVDTGSIETVVSDLGVPAAVKFDSRGRLHVLDSLRGEVVRLNADRTRSVVGRVAASTADNIAFDDADRLFVSSYGDGFLIELEESASPRQLVPGGALNAPGGLAWVEAPDGPLVYVADFFALRGLDAETGEERYLARDIIGFSDLGSVTNVATGDNGQIVLTSWLDGAVRIWDPASDERGAEFTDLARPVAAVSLGGRLLVSEADTGRVLLLDPARAEERRAVAEGLVEPAGLAVSDTDAFVADRMNGTVLQIIENGEALDPARLIADSLVDPEGIAATAEAVYVVESGAGRLTRIDLGNRGRTVLLDSLVTHDLLFDGIAIGGSRIYVTGESAGVIYALEAE